MKEGLTKENFWNEMMEKYPEQMKSFCKYIDDYKESNDWQALFNDGYIYGCHPKTPTDPIMKTTKAPKFHDLPLAMQMGIFNNWCGEYNLQECKEEIETVFKMDKILNN